MVLSAQSSEMRKSNIKALHLANNFQTMRDLLQGNMPADAVRKILILQLNKSNIWVRLSGCSAVLIQVRFCCCFKTWGYKIAGGKSCTSDRFQTLNDTQLPQVNSFPADCASKQPRCSHTDHLKHTLCILHNKFRKKLIPHQFLVWYIKMMLQSSCSQQVTYKQFHWCHWKNNQPAMCVFSVLTSA